MLLTETNLNTKVVLLEKSQTTGFTKFKGIFAKQDHKTENGRVYSKKLWENCINSNSVQERLKRRQMLGELKHPEYRDIDIEKSAFIITNLWIENGYIMGEAEVTPSPTLGGILEVFLKAGCEIGISSRGEGSIVEKAGDSFVDDKDFELITFDVTLNPAVTEAVPRIMKESIYKGLENLKENTNTSELRRVINITENSIHYEAQKMDTNTEKDKLGLSVGIKIGKIVEKYREKLKENISLIQESVGLKSKLDSANLQINSLKNLNEKLLLKSEALLESHESQKRILESKVGLLEGKSQQSSLFKEDYNRLNSKYERSLELVEQLMKTVDFYEAKSMESETSISSLKESLEYLEEQEQEFERENQELRELTETELPRKERQLKRVDSEKELLLKKTKIAESQKNKLESKYNQLLENNSELETQVVELTTLLKEAKRSLVQGKKERITSQKSQTSSALSEESQKSKIQHGVSNSPTIPSRSSKITNQTKKSFNESDEEDAMTAIMNRM